MKKPTEMLSWLNKNRQHILGRVTLALQVPLQRRHQESLRRLVRARLGEQMFDKEV